MKLENKIEKDLKTENYIFVSDYCIFERELSLEVSQIEQIQELINNETKHGKLFSLFFLKVRLSRFLFFPYFKHFFFIKTRGSREYGWILLSLRFFSFSIFSTFIFYLIFIFIYCRFSFLSPFLSSANFFLSFLFSTIIK